MRELLEDVARRCPGGKFPDDYVVFDTETTGVDVTTCRVLQYGLTFVESRKRMANNFTAYIKPTEQLFIHPKAIEIHHITPELLQEKGEPPSVIVPLVIDCLKDWKQRGRMLVGHNIVNYDIPLLNKEAARHSLSIDYGENEVIDTGMLVKAAQLGMRMDERDTLLTFFRRVSNKYVKGVFWSLDRHCVPTYGLHKFVDASKAHDAGVDCDLAHFLLESLRELAQAQPGE